MAEADECYEFINWTGDVGTIADVEDAWTTITMNGDYSITANFALLSYNLTTDSTTGGSVTTPGEGTFSCDCGTVVDLVAVSEEGYHFVDWTGDVGTVADADSPATTITMEDDYDITANFEADAAGWCFIATAAYGTPMAEEIDILRQFRDKLLLGNPVGRVFVTAYYKLSPPIAESISEHQVLRTVIRECCVNPAVVLVKWTKSLWAK